MSVIVKASGFIVKALLKDRSDGLLDQNTKMGILRKNWAR
jgi:hypothetical protein